jgi:hypothetical protein
MGAELKPNGRPDTSITTNGAGGWSTGMKFDGSRRPEKNPFRLLVLACAAAASNELP